MKKLFYSMVLPAVACLGLALTSCSDDDDNNGGGGVPNLPVPTYESSSAKYEMAPGSPYSSIEFTASGNYVIVSSGYSGYSLSAAAPVNQTRGASSLAKSAFRKSSAPVSRAYFNGIYYGTYTKTGDNQYNLQGFGTITVNTSGDNACSLTVTPTSGTPVTLSATKAGVINSGERTAALCRTWNVDRVNLKAWINGSKKFDKTVAIDKLADLFEDMGEDVDYLDIPRQVIFAKTGTYMVLYSTGQGSDTGLDISSWRWEDESKGIIRYSWDIGAFDDPDGSGLITTSFSGKNMTITEEYSEEDEEDGDYREKITWYFSAAK